MALGPNWEVTSTMVPAKRRRLIVELITDRGGCSVTDLAAEMDCSAATIRRDLDHLANRNLIERSHGGAVPATAVGNEQTHGQKELQNLEGKRHIAQAALTELQDGQVVLFDAGSTTMQIAHALSEDRSFIGVTNSPVLALELGSPCDTVQLTGGSMRQPTRALVGPTAERFVEQRTFDVLFLGTNGIDPSSGLMTPNEEEARLKGLMIDNATKVVLTADITKLGKQSFIRFAEISDLDVFITDGELATGAREPFESAGVEVIDGLRA